MRRLQLDFVRGTALEPRIGPLLLAIGALGLLAVLVHGALLDARTRSLATALDERRGAIRADDQLTPAESSALAAEFGAATQIIGSLNLAWPALFRQFEAIRVPGVSLAALQPESGATGRRLRITGMARDLEGALAYVGRLAATPGFANAHLIAHEMLAEPGAATLQFVAVVDWVPTP